MKDRVYGPFLGPKTSVDSRMIQGIYCRNSSNFRYEDGALSPRYGYTNFSAIPSGFSAIYWLKYFDGYTSAGVEKEEFITVETRTGPVTRLFSVHPTTGARTEIKNGVTSVGVSNTDAWKGFNIFDTAYLINPNNATSTVFRHKIGDATSLVLLDPPLAPSFMSKSFTSGASRTFTWTGSTATYTGAATSRVVTAAGEVIVSHTGSTTGPASVNIQRSGNIDLSKDDVLSFPVSWANGVFDIDPYSFRMSIINADGSPLTFPASAIDMQQVGSKSWTLTAYWDGKTRADFDNILHFVLSYDVLASNGTTSSNALTIGAVKQRRIDTFFGHLQTERNLVCGITFVNSTTGLESDLYGPFEIGRQYFDSPRTIENAGPSDQGLCDYLATLHFLASADGSVDKRRIYIQASDVRYHLAVEMDDATTTWDIQISDSELLAADEYEPFAFTKADCVGGCRYEDWAVWVYGNGVLRHSMRTKPEAQSSLADDTENDPTIGQDFNLPEDKPYDAYWAGHALFVTARRGLYVQVPRGFPASPLLMSPPIRVPGSKGCAGPEAAAVWRDDNGVPCLVYMDTEGEMQKATVSPAFEGDQGAPHVELTPGSRGFLKTKLLTEPGLSSLATVRVQVDEQEDALLVMLGKRTCKLGRPNQIDGERHWESYSYSVASGGTLAYLSCGKRGKKWARSTGAIDDVDTNSSTGVRITGALMDDGAAPPANSFYWDGKVDAGDHRRISRLVRFCDSLTDTFAVTITSDLQTKTYTYPSGEKNLRTGYHQQGEEHQLKIFGGPAFSPLRKLVVEHGDRTVKRSAT